MREEIIMVKIGLLTLAEGKMREDVYRSRRPAKLRETQKLYEALAGSAELVLPDKEDIRDKADLFDALAKLRKEDVDGVLLYVPTFISAALAAMAVRLCGVPCALLGNCAPDTFSQVGYMAAVGAIEQAGLCCRRICGDITEEKVKKELLQFFTACHAKKQLAGSTYGMFGGRSLGISTGTADTAQWMKIFGVDIEQIDQLGIVTAAEKIPAEDALRCAAWVKEHYGKLQYEEGKFSDAHLDKMVRSYLAVKQLCKSYSLDFAGIKCQPDMSNGYVLQCLTVQLLNDPYDADGAKNAFVCSCEADCDGALTMQILNLLSGGKPTALQDIYYYDKEKLVLANCGSSASWFAAHADKAEENLKEVHLIPHGFGEAGGAATQFTFAPGEYTYARLFRKNGAYKLALCKAKADLLGREQLKDYCWYRPTAVVRGVDADIFSRLYGCNHLHCVAGDYTAELCELAGLYGIECIRLDARA